MANINLVFGAFSWEIKKQNCNARSTVEAEHLSQSFFGRKNVHSIPNAHT
jgi:hypothetical protein